MPTIDVVNMHGKAAGTMELEDSVFGIEPNVAAMHLVVRSYLAAQRQGTQSTLTRSMVRGGGRKIYRQKGTGRARHHGNRAPQFRHGGVAFAPQPRDYVVKVPRKVRRLAMKSALSAKYAAGAMVVVDEIKLKEAKTKEMVQVLKDLGCENRTLLVTQAPDESIRRASGNLQKFKNSYTNTINVYDILNADKLVFTKEALGSIQEVYAQ
jgi:large subunit ribosomal protein L4